MFSSTISVSVVMMTRTDTAQHQKVSVMPDVKETDSRRAGEPGEMEFTPLAISVSDK